MKVNEVIITEEQLILEAPMNEMANLFPKRPVFQLSFGLER